MPREDEDKTLRRSIYLRQKRHDFPVLQALFDGPTANESCPRRQVSTVSLQPLYLMNSGFMLKRAEAFAGRVLARAGNDPQRQVETAFWIALGRAPDPSDEAAVRELFRTWGSSSRTGGTNANESPTMPPTSLLHLCHALLNLNEFVYLE